MTIPSSDLLSLRQTSGYIELLKVDLTKFGSSIYYFTNSQTATGYAAFGGIQYMSMPWQLSNTELTNSGTMPRPQLSVASTSNKLLLTAIVQYGDLAGATVTRLCTFEKYLDTGSSPDSTQSTLPESYTISHIVQQDNSVITWELKLPIDTAAILPGIQFLKDQVGNNIWAPGLSRNMR